MQICYYCSRHEIKKSPGYLVCDIWVLTVSDINLSTICSSHQGVGGRIPGLDTPVVNDCFLAWIIPQLFMLKMVFW